MFNGVVLPALLLFALAGGFVFANGWRRTRYQISRAQGQEIYFYAVLYGLLLLFLSFLLFWIARGATPDPLEKWMEERWVGFLSPIEVPALPRFVGAFILGWLGAKTLNLISDNQKTSKIVISEHGSQLEQFLYESFLEAQLLFVAFDSRKVYVGWPTLQPKLKPRPDNNTEYFGLLPARSGYLDETTLQPNFTTQYGPIYEQILDKTRTDIDMDDFQILLPMDKVVVIRPYSLDLPQKLFAMPSKETVEPCTSPPQKTRDPGLFGTLLWLLIAWIIRPRTKDNS